ncbi:hypothetical protein ASF87_02630 [Microbacterium sp. Leaf161]|uniref:hypothetical protein n=1 Tax=Microbacterium sp. Leaf161 TaxID=1736281 RepID=UPI0006FC6B66|nr:hypothetical protein [Microbacterium sp. Leaf161]KQR47870.1 hypothetical protein ASF87_02630 [Microbacterium sp. Leaf161]
MTAEAAEDFSQASLFIRSCSFAETHFGLNVNECNAPGAPARWGPVTPGAHSPNSFHYRGRAADLVGSEADMQRFVRWAIDTHLGELAELIHNPGGSVDSGHRVPPSFWGSAWGRHKGHVHFAI